MALKDDIADALAAEGDEAQADGIGAAIEDYVSGLKITASPVAGAVSGGTFSGAATGTFKVDGSVISGAIKTAASAMSSMTAGGDAILAAAYNTGLMAAIPTWTVAIAGTVTPPPPASPFPGADVGTVTAVFNPAPVVTKLISTFAAMGGMTSGGDDQYATDLADAIKTFYTSPISCVVQGTTSLAGSQGNGTISE